MHRHGIHEAAQHCFATVKGKRVESLYSCYLCVDEAMPACVTVERDAAISRV